MYNFINIKVMKNLINRLGGMEERIKNLMDRGYTRQEAYLESRAEAISDLIVRGFGTSHRCGFTPLKY